MISEPPIATWEARIAEREAAWVRWHVRRAVMSGRPAGSALREVRRRLARLTRDQREIVVRSIEGSEHPTAGRP